MAVSTSCVSLNPGMTGVRTRMSLWGKRVTRRWKFSRMRPLSTPVPFRCSEGSMCLMSKMTVSSSSTACSRRSHGMKPVVSTAVARRRRRASLRRARANFSWNRGSPPERVMPPPEVLKKISCFSTSWSTESTVRCSPYTMAACGGQAAAHWNAQSRHSVRSMTGFPSLPGRMAWCGQAPRQRVHLSRPRQRPSLKASSGLGDWDSGLLHQRQARGQPFRKILERMPGPSCTE